MGGRHAAAGQWVQPGNAMQEEKLHASTLQQWKDTLAASCLTPVTCVLSSLLYPNEK